MSLDKMTENKQAVVCDTFKVLGIRIDVVQLPYVIEQIKSWTEKSHSPHFITLTNVHSVMEAQRNYLFKEALNCADLSVPDGMPLVWIGRHRGYYSLRRRVYGPDLLWSFCGDANTEHIKHFFYGGADGVSEKLAEVLRKKFPTLKVVGTYAPPFRHLTQEEDSQIVEKINQAGPDVLWVGLGCPKQEIWMYNHRKNLNVPVMIGVGAAFDFYTGQVQQAPLWMREHGLEWLFRFIQEPKRLWKRYLIYNSLFLYKLFLEAVRLKHFE